MARVTFIEEAAHPELAESIAALRRGRRGELINVYRLLLHSPDIALGWFELLNAVRFKTRLTDRLREIVILRIADLNDVRYVIEQHVPKLAVEAGLTVEECDALHEWRSHTVFDAAERSALAYADAITTDVRVPSAIHEELRAHFDERQIVELTVLAGAYNMHTRVLQALEIDPEPHHQPASSPGV